MIREDRRDGQTIRRTCPVHGPIAHIYSLHANAWVCGLSMIRQCCHFIANEDLYPVAVDPHGCRCTECLTGEYVPLDLATDKNLADLRAGLIADHR